MAPHSGRVRFQPPRALCGDLEVYEADETVATVASGEGLDLLTAPAYGFIVRGLVPDGSTVAHDTPLVVYGIPG